jgi:hypothetical protein
MSLKREIGCTFVGCERGMWSVRGRRGGVMGW